MTKWPMVPLGDVLQLDVTPEAVHANENYPIIGIFGFGRGLFTREAVSGGAISASQLFRVKTNQFIYSRLKAFEGAFGVVPKDMDGRFVSNEFPTFSCDLKRLEPAFLGWFFRNPSAWTAAARSSTGIGARRERLKPGQLLRMTIPLPPLKEQQRLVEYLDTLSAKVDEAKCLRADGENGSSQLYGQLRGRVYQSLACKKEPLADVFELINGRAFKPTEWGTTGKRIIRIQNLKYPEAQYNFFDGHVDQRHLVKTGDVLFAWSGQIVSLGAHIWAHDEAILNQHIFRVLPKRRLHPRYIQEGLNYLIDEMKDKVRGLEMFHIRKQELNTLQLPIPSEEDQHRVIAYLGDCEKSTRGLELLQGDTKREIEAILPATLDEIFNGGEHYV